MWHFPFVSRLGQSYRLSPGTRRLLWRRRPLSAHLTASRLLLTTTAIMAAATSTSSTPCPTSFLRQKHGLAFDPASGQLRQVDPETDRLTSRPFEFDVNDGVHQKNQARYEHIGLLLDQVVYQKLEEAGLERVYFPEKVEEGRSSPKRERPGEDEVDEKGDGSSPGKRPRQDEDEEALTKSEEAEAKSEETVVQDDNVEKEARSLSRMKVEQDEKDEAKDNKTKAKDDDAEAAPQSFFFATPGYQQAERLLVLIHGSGVVRAGQWARRLIINDGLEFGTQLPFVERGKRRGFGVVVLNTNDNVRQMGPQFRHGRRSVRIPGSSNPVEHAVSVWRDFIHPSKAKDIAVVAHSYGGVVSMALALKFKSDFMERVFTLQLTDSVHSRLSAMHVPEPMADRLKEIGLNYVTSTEPLNTPFEEDDDDVPTVSAGHTKHEWTSHTSRDAIFKRLDALLEVRRVKKEEL